MTENYENRQTKQVRLVTDDLDVIQTAEPKVEIKQLQNMDHRDKETKKFWVCFSRINTCKANKMVVDF